MAGKVHLLCAQSSSSVVCVSPDWRGSMSHDILPLRSEPFIIRYSVQSESFTVFVPYKKKVSVPTSTSDDHMIWSISNLLNNFVFHMLIFSEKFLILILYWCVMQSKFIWHYFEYWWGSQVARIGMMSQSLHRYQQHQDSQSQCHQGYHCQGQMDRNSYHLCTFRNNFDKLNFLLRDLTANWAQLVIYTTYYHSTLYAIRYTVRYTLYGIQYAIYKFLQFEILRYWQALIWEKLRRKSVSFIAIEPYWFSLKIVNIHSLFHTIRLWGL